MMLGIGLGVWNLLSSLLDPLADDTIPILLTFYGSMFTIQNLMSEFHASGSESLRGTGVIGGLLTFGAVDEEGS